MYRVAPPPKKILATPLSANEVMAYNLSKLFSTDMHQLLIYYKYRKNTYQSVQNLYFIHYFATNISITFLAIQATGSSGCLQLFVSSVCHSFLSRVRTSVRPSTFHSRNPPQSTAKPSAQLRKRLCSFIDDSH